MNSYLNKANITGWIVFVITLIVYFFAVERTGSLWDCGEFVLGAYKLQIVHPPGAPLFLLVGRMFAWIADIFSNNQSDIAFAINLMSAICTSLAAMFVAWSTIMFSRILVFGHYQEPEGSADIACNGAGLIAGLVTAFSCSIWFSAVEGEVYAMSTMFTALTLWAAVKWYYLSNDPKNDKWLIFAFYATGLSIGVHLLSLLIFPLIALLYYFKKYEKHTYLGMMIAAGIGVVSTILFQSIIISGIPTIWSIYEKFMVNSLGLPFHSGIIPTILTIAGISYYGMRYCRNRGWDMGHKLFLTYMLVCISFSTIGVVVIRALAGPPINMNAPTDVFRVLPYLNREQYGERPLLKGPTFEARPIDTKTTDRWGRVGDKYAVVDHKMEYVFAKKDEIFLPRISHNDQGRTQLHRMWMDYLIGRKEGSPNSAYNLKFMWNYQFGWMYWRYFMWNFVGRENFEQGFYPWNHKDGNWASGIKAFDSAKLYNQNHLPRVIREDQSRNSYYFLPLLLGILGVIYNFRKNRDVFFALLSVWFLAGLGICFFNNSPPNEPRERDYVLIGSFMIFCMWIGMGVLMIYDWLKKVIPANASAYGISAAACVVPAIMAFQNMDDLGRNGITAARDYAINILESCKPNAILFTYGDNDTYPVWYAQEVENVRRDVRVINLSLIAVDWYIAGQRRKINESDAVKMSITDDKMRGFLRNQVFYYNPENPDGKGVDREMSLTNLLKYMGEDHEISAGGDRTFETHMPSRNIYMEFDRAAAVKAGMISETDSSFISRIPLDFRDKGYLTKDEIAVLDIINSNINDRPVYFSVTCQEDKLMGLNDYTVLDGMALRIVPSKSNSDKNMYIYGAGKMEADYTYDVVMNKWKWGNFDKKQLFVDHSYGPSVQAMRMVMMRLCAQLMTEGKKDKAADVANKFFEAFPNMNFQYDVRVMPFIQTLIDAGKFEDAKKHIRILTAESVDMMDFYNSLSAEELQAGFSSDKNYVMSAINEVLERIKNLTDTDFKNEIEGQLKKYQTTPISN